MVAGDDRRMRLGEKAAERKESLFGKISVTAEAVTYKATAREKTKQAGGVDDFAAEIIGRERESEGNLKFKISNGL